MERGPVVINNNHNDSTIQGDGVILNFNPVSNFVQHARATDLETIEHRLKPVWSATAEGRDAPPGCLPDTRVHLLREIRDWSIAVHGPHIFWLSGIAGTGKTTIMRSTSEAIRNDGSQVVSFFISRKLSDRRQATETLHTLVAGIARIHPDARVAILDTLNADDRLTQLALDTQVEKLLLDPLRVVCESESPVKVCILIDALDECEDLDELGGPEFLGAVLRTIVELDSCRIKLVVSSRPELAIRNCFASAVGEVGDGLTKEIKLHEIDADTVQMDIKRFLSHHFATLAKRRRISTPWPSTSDFDSIVDRANGLFVYAATAIGFIQDKRFSPTERLRELLETSAPRNPHDPSPYAQLDQLYCDILERFLGTDNQSPDSTLCTRVRLILAVVLYSFEALSTGALTELLGLKLDELEAVIDGLAAFIVLNSHPEPTPTVHASVVDFLADPARCRDIRFQLSSQNGHTYVALRCLVVMRAGLKAKATEQSHPLPSSNEFMTAHNQPLGLRYACRQWHNHLQLIAFPISSEMQELLVDFCEKGLLLWVRAMCVGNLYTELRHSLYKLSPWSQLPELQENPRLARAMLLLRQLAAAIASVTPSALQNHPEIAESLALFLPDSLEQLRTTYPSDSLLVTTADRILPLVHELHVSPGEMLRMVVSFDRNYVAVVQGRHIFAWSNIALPARMLTVTGRSTTNRWIRISLVAFSSDGILAALSSEEFFELDFRIHHDDASCRIWLWDLKSLNVEPLRCIPFHCGALRVKSLTLRSLRPDIVCHLSDGSTMLLDSAVPAQPQVHLEPQNLLLILPQEDAPYGHCCCISSTNSGKPSMALFSKTDIMRPVILPDSQCVPIGVPRVHVSRNQQTVVALGYGFVPSLVETTRVWRMDEITGHVQATLDLDLARLSRSEISVLATCGTIFACSGERLVHIFQLTDISLQSKQRATSVAGQIPANARTVDSLEFSPDGKCLAGIFYDLIVCWEVESGEISAVVHPSRQFLSPMKEGWVSASTRQIDFIANDTIVACVGAAILSVNMDTERAYSREDTNSTAHRGSLRIITCSLDGKLVLLGRSGWDEIIRSSLEVHSLESGERIPLQPIPDQSIHRPSDFGFDSRCWPQFLTGKNPGLVVVWSDGIVGVWHGTSFDKLIVFDVFDASWNPECALVKLGAVAAEAGTLAIAPHPGQPQRGIPVWDTWNQAFLWSIPRSPNQILLMAWSADGKVFATLDLSPQLRENNTSSMIQDICISIWHGESSDATCTHRLELTRGPRDVDRSLSFLRPLLLTLSRDGRRIALNMPGGTGIHMWELLEPTAVNGPLHQWYISTRQDVSTSMWRSGCFSWDGLSFALFATMAPCAAVAPICVIQFPQAPEPHSGDVPEEIRRVQPRTFRIAGNNDVETAMSAVTIHPDGCIIASFRSVCLQLQVGRNLEYWSDTTSVLYHAPDRVVCWLPSSRRPVQTGLETGIIWGGRSVFILRPTDGVTLLKVDPATFLTSEYSPSQLQASADEEHQQRSSPDIDAFRLGGIAPGMW